MSKLSAKERAKLPPKAFGLPEKAMPKGADGNGEPPIPDRGHAISAMRLSRLERDRGNLTKDEFDRINRKAGRILEKKNTKKKK